MVFEQASIGDFTYYHQNQNGWLAACAANHAGLLGEYKRRLQANESARDFFGDWLSVNGLSDAGYYLGCEFVKHLWKEHSLRELAGMDTDTVYRLFCQYEAE